MGKKVLTKREIEERNQRRRRLAGRITAIVVIFVLILTAAYALLNGLK